MKHSRKNKDIIVDCIKKNDHFLFEILVGKKIITKDEAGAFTYALIDIAESVERIYFNIVPQILEKHTAKKEVLQDLFWDIREEFRHIQYHINDAKLTDL